MGRDGWSLLAPLRYILSLLYGIHSRSARTPSAGQVPSAGKVPSAGQVPPAGTSGAGPKIISVGNIAVGGGGKTP